MFRDGRIHWAHVDPLALPRPRGHNKNPHEGWHKRQCCTPGWLCADARAMLTLLLTWATPTEELMGAKATRRPVSSKLHRSSVIKPIGRQVPPNYDHARDLSSELKTSPYELEVEQDMIGLRRHRRGEQEGEHSARAAQSSAHTSSPKHLVS